MSEYVLQVVNIVLNNTVLKGGCCRQCLIETVLQSAWNRQAPDVTARLRDSAQSLRNGWQRKICRLVYPAAGY